MRYSKDHWERRIAGRSDLSPQLVHLTRSTTIDGEKLGPVDVLVTILLEQRISGSTTESGFIVGDIPATCFQDSPVYSLSQNIYAEEQYCQAVPDAKPRYMGVGLMFRKPYVYDRGGRPVVYENTARAKKLLPHDEWWRIVGFDLSDEDNIASAGGWEHTKDLDEADAFAEALSRCLVRHARILLRYGKITRKCRRRHGGFGTFLHNPLSDEDNIVDWTHEREWRIPGGFEFELAEATVLLPNQFGFDRFIVLCDEHRERIDILRSIRGIVNLGSVFF